LHSSNRENGEGERREGRTQKFALYSFPSDIKCFPFAEANDLHSHSILPFWTVDSGCRISVFPPFVFINQLSNLTTTNEGWGSWQNPRRILATRVALCTNLRPHLLTVATSSDKLSTQQQAFHPHHPINHPITHPLDHPRAHPPTCAACLYHLRTLN